MTKCANDTPDLWPDDLAEGNGTPPATLLIAQADLLTSKTGGAVQGRVASRVSGRFFVHKLFLEAPALSGYSYHALTVRHDVTLFPAELLPMVPGAPPGTARGVTDFLECLGVILRSDGMANVVKALVAQSQHPDSFAGDDEDDGDGTWR